MREQGLRTIPTTVSAAERELLGDTARRLAFEVTILSHRISTRDILANRRISTFQNSHTPSSRSKMQTTCLPPVRMQLYLHVVEGIHVICVAHCRDHPISVPQVWWSASDHLGLRSSSRFSVYLGKYGRCG